MLDLNISCISSDYSAARMLWHTTQHGYNAGLYVLDWKNNYTLGSAELHTENSCCCSYMAVKAAEYTLAWHPCFKWTDTINPGDTRDLLTEQDKISASTHHYTWPVAHVHILDFMAYIMCTAAKTVLLALDAHVDLRNIYLWVISRASLNQYDNTDVLFYAHLLVGWDNKTHYCMWKMPVHRLFLQSHHCMITGFTKLLKVWQL